MSFEKNEAATETVRIALFLVTQLPKTERLFMPEFRSLFNIRSNGLLNCGYGGYGYRTAGSVAMNGD